jgi:hypothetical protein
MLDMAASHRRRAVESGDIWPGTALTVERVVGQSAEMAEAAVTEKESLEDLAGASAGHGRASERVARASKGLVDAGLKVRQPSATAWAERATLPAWTRDSYRGAMQSHHARLLM